MSDLTTKLSTNIFKFNNQYFYGEKVGTYLIDLSETILLFEIPSYNKELENYLRDLIKNKKFVCVLSHGSCGIEDGSIWQKKLGLKVYLHAGDTNHSWLRMKPDVLFSSVPDLHKDVKIIHTPGHSDGSVCLLHEPSKSLLSGDTIYNKSNKLNLDNNVNTRMEGVRNLLTYSFENIYPFHYESVIKNAKEKLEKFIVNN